MSLELLAEEYRRERRAILSGKSLDALIAERKKEQEESSQRFEQALQLLQAFLDGDTDLETTIRFLKKARVRSKELGWVLWGLDGTTHVERKARLEEFRRECQQQGWVLQAPAKGKVKGEKRRLATRC
jgi:hypothetical protein